MYLFDSAQGVNLPEEGMYATGMMFIDKTDQTEIQELFTGIATQFDLQVKSVQYIVTLNQNEKKRVIYNYKKLIKQ